MITLLQNQPMSLQSLQSESSNCNRHWERKSRRSWNCSPQSKHWGWNWTTRAMCQVGRTLWASSRFKCSRRRWLSMRPGSITILTHSPLGTNLGTMTASMCSRKELSMTLRLKTKDSGRYFQAARSPRMELVMMSMISVFKNGCTSSMQN